jgi:hypothetical protein
MLFEVETAPEDDLGPDSMLRELEYFPEVKG